LINKIVLILVFVASFVIMEASAGTSVYHLTVKAEPNIIFITGGGDYNAGQVVKLDAAPSSWQDYSFVGWKVDGRWSLENPPSIRMDRPHTAVAVYEKTGLIGGGVVVDTIPRITDISVDGIIYLVSELPLKFSWTINSNHIIDIPEFVKQDPNTRYRFDSWKDQNKDALRTVSIEQGTDEFIVLYKKQYLLKSISSVGNIQGTGWHDKDSEVSFSIDSRVVISEYSDDVRYVFDSWSGGDYPNDLENYIDLTGPVTLKANWKQQFILKLSSNIPDYDVAGSGWKVNGKNVVLVAEKELQSSKSDINYVFKRWVSIGPNPIIIPNAHSPTTSITLDNSYEIAAQYGKSYRVNVWTPFSSPSGGGFHEEGKVAEIQMKQTTIMIEPNKIRKVFTGWNPGTAKTMNFNGAADLDPEGKPIGKQNLLIFVDKPVNVTAKWKTQYYLDLQTEESKVTGAGWYDVGKIARISVKNPPVESLWTVNVFDGWVGDIEANKMKEIVIMNAPKTIIAEWREDKMPGLYNSLILAGIVSGGVLIYSKTHKSFSLGRKHVKELIDESKPFEKFFNLRKPKSDKDQHPSFYQKPKKKKAVMNWLMGRE